MSTTPATLVDEQQTVTTTPKRPRGSLARRALAATGVLAAAAATAFVTAPAAQASAPCSAGTYEGQTVYYCDVWSSGNIPVFASTSSASGEVDRLVTGGSANWFYCQQEGSSYSAGGYTSTNWAKTLGDNSNATGWVPAVYYAGAEASWASLPSCGSDTPPPPASSDRASALARAATWLTASGGGPVPYSQSAYLNGYRTDCSGYVSMALGLDPGDYGGPNTVGLTASSITRPISTSELAAGDLLIDATGDSNTRHVVMFEAWTDSSHTSYMSYEQSGDGGTHHRTHNYGLTSGSEYSPYRPVVFGD